MRKIRITFVLLLILMGASAYAQDTENEFYFKLAKIRWYLFWGADLLPTGADFTVGYKGLSLIPGKETLLQITAGGGYDGFVTYRYPDGRPALPLDEPNYGFKKKEFNSVMLEWEPGIRQGLIYNDALKRNILEGFLFYRGHYDSYNGGRVKWGTNDADAAIITQEHQDYKDSSIFNDINGVFTNSIFTGFSYNGIKEQKAHQTKNGVSAEASIEWDPNLKNSSGNSDFDFLRFNFQMKGFYTIFDASPNKEMNTFSIYLGDNFVFDYLSGSNIPMYVMQTIGGTTIKNGLGGYHRGFEQYTYDTNLKILNNLEIRMNLPAVHSKSLIPGFLTYFDSGFYRGYTYDPGELKQGFLCSTGFGAYIDVFGVEYVRFYVHFPLVGDRVDGKQMVTDINFSLHF